MSDEEVYFGEVRQFWQTDQLYRVEHARRALIAARVEAEQDRLWREDLARREVERRGVEAGRARDHEEAERRLAWGAWRAERRAERRARRGDVRGLAERNRWVWVEHRRGRSYREIAADIGVSIGRARQIFCDYEQFEIDRLALWVRDVWRAAVDETQRMRG